MADGTAIEWTQASWNPVSGCDRVSAGCDHCYAATMARRLKAMGSRGYQRDGDPVTSGPGFGVTLHDWALTQPLRWRKPRRIFVNSMSDLFHAEVPDDYIAKVFAVMAYTPQHTYQVLTKRHARMRSLLNQRNFRALLERELIRDPALARQLGWPLDDQGSVPPWPLRNVWLGVSVEDQKWADIRIPALLETPAAIRFLSCEPLLGPLDLTPWMPHPGHRRPGWPLHWVIVGGESGREARPMHPQWPQDLRDQCVAAGVPFFFKQHGEWAPGSAPPGTRRAEAVVAYDGEVITPPEALWTLDGSPDELNRRRWAFVHRAGKHAAGRELGVLGRTWDEFPPAAA